MCGIVAMRSGPGGVDAESLKRATSALRHRGPDGERTWMSASKAVGLGHARLAIMDPEGGAQPLASEDGRLHLVCNGEFYGFEAIRKRLEGRGHRFQTRSDSEIALHLYEDLGSRCVEHLRGQFAFVIWDEDRGMLLAARDRFGLKPLFYSEHDGTLMLASEAKALFAAGVRPGWDHQGVYGVLQACPDPSRSLFSSIAQVPPGHLFVSTAVGSRLERYWDVPTPGGHNAEGHGTEAAVQERVRELVSESVRLRMRADVPVGCLLSGGLDSSSVLGIAAAGTVAPVSAFTVGFDHAHFDERDGAAEAATFAKARHEVVPVTDKDVADGFHDAVWHGEMVQYNGHGTARFLLSRGVHQAGHKSVLAGEGADEVFFGYEFTRAASRTAVRRTWIDRLTLPLRLLRSPRRRYPGLYASSPWMARLATLLDISPALLQRLTGALGGLRSVLSADFLGEFEGDDLYRNFYMRCDREAGISSWPPARQLTYLWLRSLFVNYHLAADRLDMAHGVEVRLPFLDHVLFEYAQQLPLDVLAGGRREKHILREAVRAYIPDAVYRRDKRPFWAPPGAASGTNPLNELVQDTLRSAVATSVPFLDPKGVDQLLARLPTLQPEAHASVDSLLLVLTSLCVLQERYGL